MDYNREQAVQRTIGDSLGGLLKEGVVLACLFGVAVLTGNLIANTVAKPLAGNTTTMFVVGGSLLVFAYLVVSGVARVVCVQPAHYVLFICGSGGHTAEMIQMVERSIRPEKSSHRRWAVGKDDQKSYEKVLAFERRLLERFSHHNLDSGTFDIVRFGRARYVHQSWLTTPFTAILSLFDIARILFLSPPQQPSRRHYYPGVIVTNGPGTGFLFLLVARILKIFRVVPASHMRSIYVESWARVKSLSLTGKLIKKGRLADQFIVQSRQLIGPKNKLSENLLVMPTTAPVPLKG